MVQPSVTTNIIWIATILFGPLLVPGVFPLYHVNYTNKDTDLPCKPMKEFQWGQMARLGTVFFVNNRCRGTTVDSEQLHNDCK